MAEGGCGVAADRGDAARGLCARAPAELAFRAARPRPLPPSGPGIQACLGLQLVIRAVCVVGFGDGFGASAI